MSNKITKTVASNNVYIWNLKFNILISFVKIGLKNSFIILFKLNFVTLGISLFSLTYSIGFFQTNAKSEQLAHFIHKNVPGVYLTSTELSWQTFQKTQFLPIEPISYVQENNKPISWKFLKQILIEKQLFIDTTKSINYWGDHLQLQFEPKWKSYKKQYFFGTKTNITKSDNEKPSLSPFNRQIFVARDNLGSHDYDYLLQNTKGKEYSVNLFQKPFYCLDEYPLNLKQSQQSSADQRLNFKLPKQVNPQDSKIDYKLNQPILTKLSKYESNFKNKNLNGIENVYFQTKNKNITEFFHLISPNSHWQNYDKFQNLQIQLQDFFYKKNSLFDYLDRMNIKLALEGVFKNPNLNSVSSSQILFFLEKTDNTEPIKKDLGEDLLFDRKNIVYPIRKMSGFLYPDLTNENVLNLIKKTQYYEKFPQIQLLTRQLTDQVNIHLGSHFSYPISHEHKVVFPTKPHYKYYPIRLDGNNGHLSYTGPGVISTDSEKLVSNFDEVWNNFKVVFDTNNPRQLNLFRNFQKTPIDFIILNYTNNGKDKSDFSAFDNAKSQQYPLGDQITKEISSEREPIDTHVDYKSEYLVPRLPNNKSWFNQTSPAIAVKTRLVNSFPVRQVSFIPSSNFYSLFDVLDYQNPIERFRNLFSSSIKNQNKLNFYEFNQQQSPSTNELTRQTFFTIGYFKKFHPYSLNEKNNNQGSFYDYQTNKNELYEPIHINSWLMINQYLFALFIAYILSQLTKEYGRELVSYLVDLISSLGIFDESFKDELTGDSSSSGYRLIQKPKKKFKDIAGVDHIFSDLSEIIWFLRNSGRSFNVGNILSKGILLVGPPGTGKTLLVQTIAGEAQVPVLVQSASALNSIEGLGAQRLQNLFEKAKQLSPCVIFFDEIDSIGERRMHIIQETAQTSKLLQIISCNEGQKTKQEGLVLPFKKQSNKPKRTNLDSNNEGDEASRGSSSEQLGLLMQLLIELDGLQSARRVVIIGATNRPNVLDPALTRPGRLDKVFQLGLPDKEKRIEICQLYTQILGFNADIAWDYIGNQTFGLSGADLAAIVNQSAIQAILKKTKHTMETLELAIDKITGDTSATKSIQESQLENLSNPYLPLTRFAYYHAGLAISQWIAPQKKDPILCSLFPTEKNERYTRMIQKLLSSQFIWTQRHQLEAELISIYSGKILELLYLGQNVQALTANFAHSDLGRKEMLKGTNFIYWLTNKWFLYSQNLVRDKLFYFQENKNKNEILEPQIYSFLEDLSNNYQSNIHDSEKIKYQNFQCWSTKSWWQSKISNENASFINAYADWYRIYVTNPDETETNDEWIAPDRYFHSNDTYLLTRTVQFNNFYKTRRDLTYQAILEQTVLYCFNEFKMRSEFNDFFVMNLIQKQQLRQSDMKSLYSQFFV